MCYSPCFVHATRDAFALRQLLQCRTCGSQAFHVLDCCRHPDYVRVPTSPLGKTLKTWFGAVRLLVWEWLLRRHQRPAEPVTAEVLDTWETRPIVIRTAGAPPALRQTDIDNILEASERETLLTRN